MVVILIIVLCIFSLEAYRWHLLHEKGCNIIAHKSKPDLDYVAFKARLARINRNCWIVSSIAIAICLIMEVGRI